MTDAVLGIDVSKNTFDTNLGAGIKARSQSFANSPDGWHHLIAWLGEHKIGQVHACLEATGRHGLGIALALHEAGHVVSIVNPAQIRDFARTKLGRNKTDQVDAVQIREYAELFKPRPWTPPSPAMRRLCELQTIRAGTVAGLTEWKNRRGSGMADDLALSLAETTIQHFTSQLKAVDQAIAETIGNDLELSAKRDLLVSINGVGAGWHRAGRIAGSRYPRLQRRGRCLRGLESAATPVWNLGQPARADLQNWQCRAPHRLVHAGFVGDALQPSGHCFGRSAQGSGAPQGKADCDRCYAQAPGALLRRAEDRQGIRPGDGDG